MSSICWPLLNCLDPESGTFHWKEMQKRRLSSERRWKSRQMHLRICHHNFFLLIRYYSLWCHWKLTDLWRHLLWLYHFSCTVLLLVKSESHDTDCFVWAGPERLERTALAPTDTVNDHINGNWRLQRVDAYQHWYNHSWQHWYSNGICWAIGVSVSRAPSL